MEENFYDQNPQQEKEQMCINGTDKAIITSSCKWARFIAIFSFAVMGLGLLACLIMLFVCASGNLDYHYIIFSISILFGILIGFFPTLYLYRYAYRGLVAAGKDDGESMSVSLLNLKKYFEFTGILTIVVLVFYILLFAIGIPLGLFD